MNNLHNSANPSMFLLPWLPLLAVLFVGGILLFFASIAFRIVKAGGIKATMFGAPIVRTVGEVSMAQPLAKFRTVMRVHLLRGDQPGRDIGLEILTTGPSTYRMMPVSLSRTDAQELANLLQSALQGG